MKEETAQLEDKGAANKRVRKSSNVAGKNNDGLSDDEDDEEEEEEEDDEDAKLFTNKAPQPMVKAPSIQ